MALGTLQLLRILVASRRSSDCLELVPRRLLLEPLDTFGDVSGLRRLCRGASNVRPDLDATYLEREGFRELEHFEKRCELRRVRDREPDGRSVQPLQSVRPREMRVHVFGNQRGEVVRAIDRATDLDAGHAALQRVQSLF